MVREKEDRKHTAAKAQPAGAYFASIAPLSISCGWATHPD
jgi:hypothetical protein